MLVRGLFKYLLQCTDLKSKDHMSSNIIVLTLIIKTLLMNLATQLYNTS